uniref:Putative bacterial extracellular solute-binding protein, family 5 n=1 Tax=uncultured marine microorganism HF4000_APKG10K24 TaxID=455562 RepID=B3TCI5_9ZZZZ|nr:putative bacterial extracellular solute-binding protein, family 5 [uncultured marine microorganism HF4000_APKG10K24]
MVKFPQLRLPKVFAFIAALILMVVIACGADATATSPAPTQASQNESTTPPTQASQPEATTSPNQATSGKPVTLRVGTVADTYRNDPNDLSRLNIGMFPLNVNVFDQLLLVDENFQLQPMLAESWSYSEDTGTWKFDLREGVTFHDGQRFDAHSVVEMVQRFWSQGVGGNRLRIGENSAVALDDFTVLITPTSDNLRLPEELSHSSYGIRAPGSDPLEGEHIGTGAFIMSDYQQGSHITVEKNTEYWNSVPKIDELEFRFMPDPNTRILALQAGEVGAIFDVPPEATSLLERNTEIQVIPTAVSASQYVMVLLTGEAPYDLAQDINVREAIGYGINRQAILDISFNGHAELNQTFSPPGVLGPYAGRIIGYTHDPERSRTILEEAGWIDEDGDGFREKGDRKLTLEFINGFPAGPENGQTAEIIQAQLKEVGIDLKVTNVPDNATYSARLRNKEGDMFMEIGNQNSPSACFLASLFYGRYENPGSYSRGFAPGPLGWPEYDDEIDACNAALTTDEAAMHRANAIHIVVDESRSLLPLVGITRIYAARNYVKDFNPHPVRLHVRWDTVTVEE